MTKKEREQQLRDICTYHSDDGTSGYNLSENQFRNIFYLFNEQREKIIHKIKTLQSANTEVDIRLTLNEQRAKNEAFEEILEELSI